ncbi:hypothetical protein [Pseudomonas sp. NPDC089401]|uniref:hypothetical protein n=1 Tax=Pseudomonas sp. NPDC089401 TaxID=3364462 RepID=UPI00380F4553
MKIVVRSESLSPQNSALLKEIAQGISQRGLADVEEEKKYADNTKGELVTGIIIGVITNAVYDGIKAIIKATLENAKARNQAPDITIEEKNDE